MEEAYKRIRTKNVSLARSHVLSKIHQDFVYLPKLRPFIDTTSSTRYHVGQYLSEIFQALTVNNYKIEDSFVVVNRMINIPQKLFNEGYRFVSFNVKSLFTNVLLQRSINVISKRIYDDKLIDTDIKKNTKRKLIKDTCKKTAFSFDSIIYEQIDGVSMGVRMLVWENPPALVLTNIIMIELAKIVVQKLTNNGMITFYCRYVDDTLLLVKLADIPKIYINEALHFLDIKISHLE